MTLSHFPLREQNVQLPKLSVEVKSIVICGCPQNAINFFTQLKRFTVNNVLPNVTVIAPSEPPADSTFRMIEVIVMIITFIILIMIVLYSSLAYT